MFVRSASYVKSVNEWAARAPRRSVDRAASDYARRHMVAVVMLGNDDAVAYFYDAANDRIARQVYKGVEWK